MRLSATLGRIKLGKEPSLFLFAMMAQLQLWDGVITQAFVSSGLARESNRVAAFMLSEGNYLPIKIAGALASIALLWFISRRFPALAAFTASVVCMFYLALISRNFLVFFNG